VRDLGGYAAGARGAAAASDGGARSLGGSPKGGPTLTLTLTLALTLAVAVALALTLTLTLILTLTLTRRSLGSPASIATSGARCCSYSRQAPCWGLALTLTLTLTPKPKPNTEP